MGRKSGACRWVIRAGPGSPRQLMGRLGWKSSFPTLIWARFEPPPDPPASAQRNSSSRLRRKRRDHFCVVPPAGPSWVKVGEPAVTTYSTSFGSYCFPKGRLAEGKAGLDLRISKYLKWFFSVSTSPVALPGAQKVSCSSVSPAAV